METMKLPQENQESKEKKLETLKIIHKKKNRNSKIRILNKNKKYTIFQLWIFQILKTIYQIKKTKKEFQG
jgi:hypothetical protein